MTEFPIHVYRSPGNYEFLGRRYKIASANDQNDLQAYLDAGWHLTMQQAFDAAGEAAKTVRRVADWRAIKSAKQKKRKDFKASRVAAATPPVLEATAVEVLEDNAPVTRAELETKARELGIKFDGRTGDKTLLARIESALKEV